jgi:hypothetical protein
MPLSPQEEVLCERLEKGEPVPSAAAFIRQQAHEIDDLWDRLNRAYALSSPRVPVDMIQQEMEQLRAMLNGRRSSQRRRASVIPLPLRPIETKPGRR